MRGVRAWRHLLEDVATARVGHGGRRVLARTGADVADDRHALDGVSRTDDAGIEAGRVEPSQPGMLPAKLWAISKAF